MTYADGRYGALDIGTVTCRLLVADVEDGRIIDVDKEYAITDLGVGVDATGRLSEAAIERVLAYVDRYLEVLARYDTPEHPVRRLIAMATSASRDARRGRRLTRLFLSTMLSRCSPDARRRQGTRSAPKLLPSLYRLPVKISTPHPLISC